MAKEDMDLNQDLGVGVEEEEEYLVPGSIVEVLYGFSWKAAIIFATPSNDDDDDDCFLVRLLGDEFGGFCAVKDVRINKFLIRMCRRKVVREWLTCLLCVCEKANYDDEDKDEEEEDGYQCQEKNCGSYIVYCGQRRRGAKRSKLPSHTHCSPLKKPRKEKEEEEAVEEEERRRRLLVYILSLPRSRRTWLWDNEIEKYTPSRSDCNLFSGSHIQGSSDHNLPSQPVMGDMYIPDESYSSGCASSSVASCSTSTQNVSTCGCVNDIDRDSDYYFSDAESSCW